MFHYKRHSRSRIVSMVDLSPLATRVGIERQYFEKLACYRRMRYAEFEDLRSQAAEELFEALVVVGQWNREHPDHRIGRDEVAVREACVERDRVIE